MLKGISSFLPRLWANWITLTGAIIATVAGSTIILAVAAEIVSPSPNPYASAVAFLAMPLALLFGLGLIPIGLLWERLKTKKAKADALDSAQAAFRDAFRIAFQNPSARRRMYFVGAMTVVNLILVGAAGNRALSFMDSPEFCGTLCHSVMEPEYQAYVRSPHSRVKCVECHIGPGASWAVKAKISGLRQVWAVLVNSFSRPIPAPVHELRPARDTCEQCHWPAKFHGNRVTFKSRFDDDRSSTPKVTALVLKVGGADPKTGQFHGIHWHVSPDIQVRYEVLDDKREKIGRVSTYKGGKLVTEYQAPGATGPVREERLMDCVDCHNRPTHIYDGSPVAAVDRLMASGQLDRSLPFMHKVAVAVLNQEYIPHAEAPARILADLKAMYAKEHADVKPDPAKLEEAAKALAEAYRQNIYPDLKIGWETYPSHLGHRGNEADLRGCFRCHDDSHTTTDGKANVLSQDCELCHEVLHEDEPLDSLPTSLRALVGSAGADEKVLATDTDGQGDEAGEGQGQGDEADEGLEPGEDDEVFEGGLEDQCNPEDLAHEAEDEGGEE